MGIRGLTSLINKYVPDALQHRSLQYFNGSSIAIDTSILLYKFRYSNNNQNSHISGFLNKCLSYIRYGIIPVFIIDGKPPPEKSDTIQKRHRQRARLEERIKELKCKIQSGDVDKKENMEKILKLDKQIITVKKVHHDDAQELLTILGFKVIQSSGEAEETCAYLQKSNMVNFTYSDDTDVLALGCPSVLRSNSKSNYLTEVNLEKVLEGLGIDIDQFVDLCILCGCDYCPNIPRLNYQKAYDLIKEHGNIETVLLNYTDAIPTDYNFQDARNIFKRTLPPVIDLTIEVPQIDELRLYRFLAKHKYSKLYTDKYILKFKHITLTNFHDKCLRRDESSERLASFFKK
jgi:flap endonuclease-1